MNAFCSLPTNPAAIAVVAGISVLALSAPLSAPLSAQTPSDPADALETPEVIGKMFDCREIADPTERLACFDREVAKVFEAQESKELVLAEREQIVEAKRGLFGLNLPKIRLFGGSDGDDDVNEITATLANAEKLGNGRHIFELEDGARWIETESTTGFRRFGAGDTIVIKKAALGSFKAKVNNKRAVKVRRLN
ncbi:hypothetical protein [Erythrobacter rubeus]|uniref:Uncharacterized protein n=1 Tax=Erythrobacter rubeus TaxID=2760803 RepID=A0ABR8KPE1_9SPHN|nr:hypothetical protein [Erythrobacter rubeus]MBD2842567.1 hypothetical protein [Erythrobacter rubeus]